MANERVAGAGAPHSTDSPAVGTILGGKFRVVRQLGEGGMGLVLEAENVLTGKRVAIKWMRPQLASKPEAVERFLREARASSRVRHPNVVDVYDVVHEGASAFLVMELLDGEPLTAVLERGGMPAHELISLLLDAMRGVAAAHKQGVIHRDIKPDNIFLAEETDRARRTPKVLDFGISKLAGLAGTEGLSLTQTGVTLGTPLYMSFEQLCGVRDIDARTDVYAFGVILYEALTGRPPFEAETFTELIIKITNTRPTPPKALRGDIPRTLDTLIQSAMAKERNERLPSLEAMIRELERFSTAEAFRAQMTIDHAPMPRVVSPSQQPPPEQKTLLSERAETGQADTPMNTSVPVSVIPRRRDLTPWLVGGAVVAALLSALMFIGPTKQPTAAVSPPTAAPEVLPQPAAASPSVAVPGPEHEDIPFGKAPPSAASVEAATPGAHHLAETLRPHANTAQLQHPEPQAPHSERSTHPPPSAAPVVSKPVPVQPAKVPTNLRAGRPRSQDF